jgi:hypothetical protein
VEVHGGYLKFPPIFFFQLVSEQVYFVGINFLSVILDSVSICFTQLHLTHFPYLTDQIYVLKNSYESLYQIPIRLAYC